MSQSTTFLLIWRFGLVSDHWGDSWVCNPTNPNPIGKAWEAIAHTQILLRGSRQQQIETEHLMKLPCWAREAASSILSKCGLTSKNYAIAPNNSSSDSPRRVIRQRSSVWRSLIRIQIEQKLLSQRVFMMNSFCLNTYCWYISKDDRFGKSLFKNLLRWTKAKEYDLNKLWESESDRPKSRRQDGSTGKNITSREAARWG